MVTCPRSGVRSGVEGQNLIQFKGDNDNVTMTRFLLVLALICATSATVNRHQAYEIAKLLRPHLKGYVFLRGSPDYETARPVHNGLCKDIFPLMIIKPLSTEDVSKVVQTAAYYGVEISVRSGGHSYQCLGIKVKK